MHIVCVCEPTFGIQQKYYSLYFLLINLIVLNIFPLSIFSVHSISDILKNLSSLKVV